MHWLVIPMFACDWDCVRTAKRLWSFCLLVSDVFETYLWCFLLPLLFKSEDQSCGAALKYLAFARVESWIVVSLPHWESQGNTIPRPAKTLQHQVCQDRMRGGFSYNIMRHHCGSSVMAQSMAMTYDPDRKIRTNWRPPIGITATSHEHNDLFGFCLVFS